MKCLQNVVSESLYQAVSSEFKKNVKRIRIKLIWVGWIKKYCLTFWRC
jgi:hypothetical protein